MIEVIPSLGTALEIFSIGVFLYLAQKLVDNAIGHFFDKKVFSPIFKRIKRKIKIIKTRADPVAATFSLSYTPQEDITVESAVERLKTVFEEAEATSSGKVAIVNRNWSLSDREGTVEFQYPDQKGTFKINIDLIQDVDSLESEPSPDPDRVHVGSIGLEIEFDFPFQRLEDTLFNLGSLINYIEDGFEDQIRGNFSGGRFVISPVKNDLALLDKS